MRKVLILDTSILCVWLKVPGKETCGSGANTITYDTVHTKIEEEVKKIFARNLFRHSSQKSFV